MAYTFLSPRLDPSSFSGLGRSTSSGTSKLIERKQLHGRIKGINQDKGIVVKVKGRRKLCRFPPDLSCFTKAKKVAYQLKSTGEWVSGLDLITYWKLIKPDPRETKRK